MQRGGHSESQGVPQRIARPCAHQFRASPVGSDVILQDRQHPRRERRAQTFTPPDLFGERRENRLPILIVARTIHLRLRIASSVLQ